MTHLFLERRFPGGITADQVLNMAYDAADCFSLHRVTWHCSFLSADRLRLFCWFESADAESARIALRQANVDISRHWPGTVHDAPDSADIRPNVLVERSFDDPVALDDLQAIEDRNAWCLQLRDVEFAQTFFSVDQRRMMCLYRAPDAESVRQAQRQAGMPFGDVWSFEQVSLP